MPRNVKLQGVMDGRIVRAMDDGEDFGYIPVQLKVVTAAGASNTVALTIDRAFTVTDVMARNTECTVSTKTLRQSTHTIILIADSFS